MDELRDKRFCGIGIVENPAVPKDEVWFVEPRKGPQDRRSDAERTTRIINVKLG